MVSGITNDLLSLLLLLDGLFSILITQNAHALSLLLMFSIVMSILLEAHSHSEAFFLVHVILRLKWFGFLTTIKHLNHPLLSVALRCIDIY